MAGHHEDEDQPLMTESERREANVGPDGVVNPDRHPDAPLDGGDGTLQVEDDSDPPTPRFVQDEHGWKRWKWVPYPLRRMVRAAGKWSKGPANPQPHRIKPLFPMVQEYPLFLVDRLLPTLKQRAWVLFFYFAIWLITFVLVKRQGTMATEVAGWGQPQTIGCGATYWGSGNSCGLHGNDCRPFRGSGFAFRCSAGCASYQVLNPRAVGDQEVIYQPLIVGGPSNDVAPGNATYRGDSYICGAAIHAGVISNAKGGCGVVKLVGEGQDYLSTQRNGLTSIRFDSYFPLSFSFLPDVQCESQDTRWPLLAISVVFTAVLSVFTSSPAVFFFPTFVGVFWTVGMATDPPTNRSVAALFSNVLGKFLPAMFVAWVMYDRMGVRRTLRGLTAQIEKTVLWLGACWVGALTNYTLNFIPIQRLNAHDLNQQPGAKAALSIIIIALAVIIASQVWFFRQEARFIKYIKLYALFLLGILLSLVLPGLNLRIHHYVLALLLLPGTSLQTRPSLLYQGVLVGLFINGIARWGFDPVLQTSAALQGDAQRGTPLPAVHAPVIDLSNTTTLPSNITFTWEKSEYMQFDGISVLVNDVERFRSYFQDVDATDKFVWSRDKTLDLPEYFRFAFMDGSDSGDYTKAGVWTGDGEWVDMKPGASKVKLRSPGDDVLGR
ncbi:LCCL domain containing protein [Metarhizium album ARSEF 1941]|uniref:LCCL domain containing protein n=1 Tax=Metarhizium album (strain ARSEF 1941) TaxID=1081103 RepID=A0A0B2WKY8_METAS|nr:LCCL domain containing protein [Metarhizium album ARSEF 1941]KHN94613.1 LCCL domain containing protein [Metarhizium album ARSEF 1941]